MNTTHRGNRRILNINLVKEKVNESRSKGKSTPRVNTKEGFSNRIKTERDSANRIDIERTKYPCGTRRSIRIITDLKEDTNIHKKKRVITLIRS